GGGERDGEQRRGERDVHDPGGDADVQSGARDVHRVGERDDFGQHGGGDDLLHDGRERADDRVDHVRRADSADADDDAAGDGGGERDGEQRRGHRDVYDPAASGDALPTSGARDVHRVGERDDFGQHGGGDNLLHDGREHADARVDHVRRADSGDADDDAAGDGGSERDGEQRRGQRHIHDPGGDADVQPGAWHVHLVGDGDDQRRDERGDDLLHDGWERADDRVDHVRRADSADADDDAAGDGGGDRDGEQRRGERHVHNRAEIHPDGQQVGDGRGHGDLESQWDQLRVDMLGHLQ